MKIDVEDDKSSRDEYYAEDEDEIVEPDPEYVELANVLLKMVYEEASNYVIQHSPNQERLTVYIEVGTFAHILSPKFKDKNVKFARYVEISKPNQEVRFKTVSFDVNWTDFLNRFQNAINEAKKIAVLQRLNDAKKESLKLIELMQLRAMALQKQKQLLDLMQKRLEANKENVEAIQREYEEISKLTYEINEETQKEVIEKAIENIDKRIEALEQEKQEIEEAKNEVEQKLSFVEKTKQTVKNVMNEVTNFVKKGFNAIKNFFRGPDV